MKIFLDTNIFYNDWFMKNANFKYLFNYINNEGHSLILSKLVIQESDNIRNRELEETLSEIKKNIKKAQKLNDSILKFDSTNLGIEDYDLKSLIKLKTDYIEEVNYNSISHDEVVQRALIKKKPFIEGEKGYRDTLIWLSLLKYLKENTIKEEVAFITHNTSDFFKINDKVVTFNQDLLEDINMMNLDSKMVPFTSLFDFINNNVDKNAHIIDYYKSEDKFEEFITDSAAEYLKNMSSSDLSYYLDNSIFETKVNNILDIRVDVFEGLEDPEVLYTTRLEKNNIYVSYRYNLRRVTLEIDIQEMVYFLNKDELDKVFYDVEINFEIATMYCLVRPYFDVSFIYNEKDEVLKDYEVDTLWLRV